ncbi:MAG: HVA1 family protein [Winogradskyella sp.]|uniref:HVA1 family protein n=1 Tax=Winogradskyella sp. TaxID=1883156 RepID=UPI00385F58A3
MMIKTGTQLQSKWGIGTASGKVKDTYAQKVTKTIKDNVVTKHGEFGNKALYIQQSDGDFCAKKRK